MNKTHNPILIITALPFESKIILNRHNINILPKKLTIYQPAESIYLIETPIGFKFEISILNREVEKISPELIINFGICGALVNTVPIGTAFCVDKVYHFAKKLHEIRLSESPRTFQSASLLTVDEAVLSTKTRDELYSQTDCRLVDMEAFHVAQYCKAHQLSLLIVKIASDLADEDTLSVIKENRSELRLSLTNAYLQLISNLS